MNARPIFTDRPDPGVAHAHIGVPARAGTWQSDTVTEQLQTHLISCEHGWYEQGSARRDGFPPPSSQRSNVIFLGLPQRNSELLDDAPGHGTAGIIGRSGRDQMGVALHELLMSCARAALSGWCSGRAG